VSPLLLVTGFVLAAALGQRRLRGAKVYTRAGSVAAIHAAIAAPLLIALKVWQGVDPLGPMLLWSGAGLCWFVVRSHLESSILVSMLEEVAGGCAERGELLRRFHAREGLAARLKELAAAGLVRGDSVTLEGRMVLFGFGLLGTVARGSSPRP